MEVGGVMTSGDTHAFSGLLICGECGYTMRYMQAGDYRSYRCTSNNRQGRRDKDFYCANRTGIRYEALVTFFDDLIRQLVASGDPVQLLRRDTPGDNPLPALERDLAKVQSNIDKLTSRLASVPDAVAGDVLRQLEALGNQRDILRVQKIQAQERQSAQRNSADATRRILDTIDISAFWRLNEREIHQRLHALLSGVKLIVLDGQIIALRPPEELTK